ncbi:hypothetical protein QBC47DRAFT_357812 [Echria macrotheca]|uniref:Uncharacterized protein n=1 Tax=Echria macrotheca TaxID=438768 RepID=A0AAJ0F9A4_9PEZI|nr:hypothetical protein QBC47DRAFT_357812 [Echria macrotheca]
MDFKHKMSMDQNDGADVSLLPRDNDVELPRFTRRQTPARQLLSYLLTALFGGLVASAIWAVFWPHQLTPSLPLLTDPPPTILECGSTAAEARSMGCKFQTWTYSWVPAPCWDAELNTDFIAVHEQYALPYYEDRNGTTEVAFDDVYTGDLPLLYTVWGSHFWHCAFLMRKFFRRRARFTEATWDYDHAKHCQMWVADPFRYDWKRVNTKAVLVFENCDLSIGFEGIGQANFETIDG